MDPRLKEAIETGDVAAVEGLLRADPGLSRGREGGLSAVMLAAYHKQDAIAGMLLDTRGPADLFEAAALDLADRVRALIGWDPRAVAARSSDGFTALHLAAYFGRPDIVRLLIEAGSYVEAVAEHASKVRPLHSGVAGRHVLVVEALLAAGADVEARQERGFTPLMGAAAGGSREILERLLVAGADKGARNAADQTAADFAREHHHGELEKLLSD
jgi:ankyrin repeat protein